MICVKRPYRYGGGHGSFVDSGYDCSGTVSYALAAAGLLRMPLSSSDLLRYGQHGRGKWITVYARNGHAYAVIAGLRLDTTAWNNRSDREAPRWHPTTVRRVASSRGTRPACKMKRAGLCQDRLTIFVNVGDDRRAGSDRESAIGQKLP